MFYPFVYLYYRTLRIKIIISEKAEEVFKTGTVFTGYHNQLIPMVFAYRKNGFYGLVSKNLDGEIADFFLKRFGYNTIRGSSREGGAEALYELDPLLKNRILISIPFDGPKGPVYKMKKGIIYLANRYKYPLVFGYSYFSRAFRLYNWDGLYIPFPFSKCLVVIDDPFYIKDKLNKRGIEEHKTVLEKKMWENYKKFTRIFIDLYRSEPVNMDDIKSEKK